MNILIVSQHYWPETFRINEVVESLQKAGCSVSVLTGQPNYPDGAIFPGYRAAAFGPQQHDAGYTIYRVPLAPRGGGTARRLAANYLSFLASACVLGPWVLRGQRFDVIFVYGTSPILQALAGIVLKRIKGAALVTWVQDLWPQSLEVTGFVRNRRVLATVEAVVRWIYRRSDLLLAQSQAFVPTVQAMAGGTPVEYHPNPGELAFGRAQPEGEPALVLEAGFNVVFAGNLGTVQALDTVLNAAELLRPHDDIRLVLIGSGGRSEWLQKEVARRGLDNVRLTGRYASQAMPGILDQASALLVSLARSPILSQTVPSKIQAYLAAGRPLIASLDGEGARVVEEAGAGIACPAEDAVALAQAVLKLRTASSEDRQRMGEAGRSYYEQHFEPAMLAHRLAQRFGELRAGRLPLMEAE
jgi:glycosyltransferase involved in cell wall biosynthesis